MHAEGQAIRWHDPARSNELSDQMASLPMLPTPRARDWKGKGKGYEDCLPNVAAKLLPTPHGMAKEDQERRPGPTGNELGRALNGATTSQPSGDGKPSTEPRPRLSPDFVGWMMGTPGCSVCGREWTDSACQHSATEFTSTLVDSSEMR